MAAKKPAAPVVERETSNLPVSYSERFAKEATDIASRIGGAAGDRIRSKANQHFIMPNGDEGTEIKA